MSQATGLVSVGFPVYNGQRYAASALESLLNQDYQNLELIISDNASTDATPDICRHYAARDRRVTFHRNTTNIGAARNFNQVFRASRGDYFMWASHDDLWHPAYIRRCVEALQKDHEAVLCTSGITFMGQQGEPIRAGSYNRLHTQSMSLRRRVASVTEALNWFSLFGLVRPEALRKTRLFTNAFGGDVILLMELLFQGTTIALPEVLFRYRRILKSAEEQLESIRGSADRTADFRPYTELAKSLLRVIDDCGTIGRAKAHLREDLLRNVCWRNVGWSRLIVDENRELASVCLYQRPVEIRALLVPETSVFTLQRLRGYAFTKAVGTRIVQTIGKLRYFGKLLDRYLLWRLSPRFHPRELAGALAGSGWRTHSWLFNRRVDRRYLVRDRYGYPLAFDPPAVADARFTKSMRTYARHRHREWLYDLREVCYIEARWGFVLGRRGELLTRPFNYHHLRKERPYRAAASLAVQRKNSIPTLDVAVSLRCFTEGNYWHFFDDLLSKLRLVDELDLPKDVPLLVGRNVWWQPFFMQAIGRGKLPERNWMEHTSMLRIRRLVIPVPMSLQRENIEYALRALDPRPPLPSDRRVLLTRGPRRRRSLANIAELLGILAELDFEIVDTDELSLADQMELFAGARLVVANHGAGLANLMFRIGQPLDLIELFAPDFIHPHFVWMAHTFGFGYEALVGDAVGDGSFRIDGQALRSVINRVLSRMKGSQQDSF